MEEKSLQEKFRDYYGDLYKPRIVEVWDKDAVLNFGKYKNSKISDVPRSYLGTLLASCKELDPDLELFLRSYLFVWEIPKKHEYGSAPVKLPCKKKAYHSEKLAKDSLNGIVEISKEDKVPQRVYECPVCGMWHLTSLSLEHYRNRKTL